MRLQSTRVVMGIAFAPIAAFRVPHVGLFWHEVIDDFPTCEHAAVIPSGNAINWVDPSTQLPLPRIWLIGKTRDELIQLQNDRFYFNWRQTEDRSDYPRFRNVSSKFFRYTRDGRSSSLIHFSTEIKPLECELSYINLLPKGKGWTSFGEVGRIFKDFAWASGPDRFLPGPDTLSWQVVFPLPDKHGTLTVRLGSAVRKADSVEVLKLELVARGLGESGDPTEVVPGRA